MSHNNRRSKRLTMAALIVGIFALSLGFAAFSNALTLSSSAAVTPNSSNFSVVFTKTSGTIDESAVVPTKTPNTITAANGTIVNTTNPTLKNLDATFTEPGQKAEYNLYVYNAGQYLAYLNSVTFKGNKVCTPATGTTASLVTAACNGITVKLNLGTDTYTSTTQNIQSNNNITNKTLAAGASQAAKVTIEYASNASRADGPFTVEFPYISLYYMTVGGTNETIASTYSGTIYRNTSDNISIGDSIELLTSGYETSASSISENCYLKHIVVDNIIRESYACIKYTENSVNKEACIRGGVGGASYGTYDGISGTTINSVAGLNPTGNIAILESIRSFFESQSGGYCRFADSFSYCLDSSLYLNVTSDDDVYLYADSVVDCNVDSDGNSYCSYPGPA